MNNNNLAEPPENIGQSGLANGSDQTNNTTVEQPVATVTMPAATPVISKKQRLKSALSTIAILLLAPILALVITAYVFQSYEVEGPSMQSTLQNADRLIIWKAPVTWSKLSRSEYMPKRGDVIVFVKRGLYEDNSGKEKQLIKRVIALPGERVTVKDGKVTVYNSQHPDGFIPDKTLPYGSVITLTEGNIDQTVPAGTVFVCGDNRQNSLDSRYFGPVPASDIVGKLVARIIPLNKAEKF